nr:MAG TPA: hypothetical protein [Caudoviricetes sp.]
MHGVYEKELSWIDCVSVGSISKSKGKETLTEESLVDKIITKVKNHAAFIQLIITNIYRARWLISMT